MADASGIGERIRLARERSGRNRNQMARELGTSWQHVARWERGQTSPSPASLRKLSSCLGVGVDYLLGHGRRARPAEHPAFDTFLQKYAPADLTEAEVQWLRDAPFASRAPTPGDYVDMLDRLRTGGDDAAQAPTAEPEPPKKSGRRARVDKQALLDELGIDEG